MVFGRWITSALYSQLALDSRRLWLPIIFSINHDFGTVCLQSSLGYRIYQYTNIRIKSNMPDAHRFFQALANVTRLRCLMLMVAEDEVCVCEMAYSLGEIQPKVSRHLAALRTAGFILDRREAQWIYYRLHPDLPTWMSEVLKTSYQALVEQAPFRADRAALANMPCRPQRRCTV